MANELELGLLKRMGVNVPTPQPTPEDDALRRVLYERNMEGRSLPVRMGLQGLDSLPDFLQGTMMGAEQAPDGNAQAVGQAVGVLGPSLLGVFKKYRPIIQELNSIIRNPNFPDPAEVALYASRATGVKAPQPTKIQLPSNVYLPTEFEPTLGPTAQRYYKERIPGRRGQGGQHAQPAPYLPKEEMKGAAEIKTEIKKRASTPAVRNIADLATATVPSAGGQKGPKRIIADTAAGAAKNRQVVAARRSKLTENDVREIRKLRDSGLKLTDIQEKYPNLSIPSIRDIAARDSWTWVK